MKSSNKWFARYMIVSCSAAVLFITGCAQQQNSTNSQAGAFNVPGQGASTNLGRNPLTSNDQRRTGPLVGQSANALGNTDASPNEKRNSAAKSPSQPDLRVSQKIANAVQTLPWIRHAYVLYAGNTAYIAFVPVHAGNTNTQLTQQQKKQVINKVKQQSKVIHTVLMTNDPQAYRQFQGYASNVPDGRPVATGSWSQIYAVIHRVWPSQSR